MNTTLGRGVGRVSSTAMAMAMAFSVGTFADEVTVDEANGTISIQSDEFEAKAQSITEYWTEDRMKRARPVPMPSRIAPTGDSDARSQEATVITEPAGFAPGWSPGSDEQQPLPDDVQELNFDLDAFEAEPMTFGAAPTNPLSGPYGPFQRWSMHGKYIEWPRSIHGKLFFSRGGGNFVCSATVINRSTLATAGHCVAAGDGVTWSTNLLFCPSWTGAPNATFGCWAGVAQTTSGRWFSNGDFDYDVACIVTAVTGTTVKDKIGNRTGWAGRAWNWSSSQPEVMFGYPQGAPFNGNVIQQVATTEWYEVDMTTGGQRSKYVGSDLTGGSSGGGWFLSWRHPHTEMADTDGSSVTDPISNGGPHINGVNSHSRCRTNCSSPPTATAGVFWQEMGSPPFRKTSTDAGESEDVFAICLSHANN